MSRLSRFFTIASLLFLTSTAAACGLYFGMRTLLGRPPIVIAVPLAHVTQYQNQYPLPYLVAIAFMFALVGTVWLTAIAPRVYRLHSLQVALVPFLTVLLAGPFWGMLWAYHDMQAGFFPDTPHMIDYLLFGAQYGFFFSFNGVGLSFPFSLLAYGMACALMVIFLKRFVHSKPKATSLVQVGS